MKVSLPRVIFNFIGGLLVLLSLGPARSLSAEEYPTRPVKLIVPFSVGGDADVIGRVLAERLGAELKQPIIVENVTGAGGNIGVERVIRSEPDGYTLLVGNTATLALDHVRVANGTAVNGGNLNVNSAAALGSGLTSTLYVLDEPTIGLHPQDSERLLSLLRDLAARGNTVLVVEHDRTIIRGADHIIDLGPAAGEHGGWVVAERELTPQVLEPERRSLKR